MSRLASIGLASVLLLAVAAPLQAQQGLDEEVTIRPGNDGEVLYEYKVNGQIMEIRVVPKNGPTYYLVPSDTREGQYIRMDDSQLLIPKWILFRW